MAKFKKGEGGRPKGAKNKKKLASKQLLEDLFQEEGGFEQLFNDIGAIEDPYQKVQAKMKVVEFFMPKLKAVELNANINDQQEDRPLEEIQADIKRLQETNKKEWPDYSDD
jgi:hypothetical protein